MKTAAVVQQEKALQRGELFSVELLRIYNGPSFYNPVKWSLPKDDLLNASANHILYREK
ncbi:hypothetical protein GJU40_14425 [Bacillus lacus]|uniref:Uncharacterized protein n=1 Tax=Metabacillus lacus TaxID=1983721 RepID=A0A7X2LZE6_9BACI|nr:hypothetical protein [Metabacillus lacus]MRX73341.1 hypothetical protein [Metabacillus lacus]